MTVAKIDHCILYPNGVNKALKTMKNYRTIFRQQIVEGITKEY